jgi:hypothetical protein
MARSNFSFGIDDSDGKGTGGRGSGTEGVVGKDVAKALRFPARSHVDIPEVQRKSDGISLAERSKAPTTSKERGPMVSP